ncbi:uncharacterized protein BJX67DRAFT_51819 [Aspergillus lucknowensis]|uniref:Secreted protein n=1 Tax=Aspergillus lucknowensis TaxID=176173 RepID=A0ABR4LUP5_9EURO
MVLFSSVTFCIFTYLRLCLLPSNRFVFQPAECLFISGLVALTLAVGCRASFVLFKEKGGRRWLGQILDHFCKYWMEFERITLADIRISLHTRCTCSTKLLLVPTCTWKGRTPMNRRYSSQKPHLQCSLMSRKKVTVRNEVKKKGNHKPFIHVMRQLYDMLCIGLAVRYIPR